MANNFYPATGLIGGAAGDLDNIDGAGLADGDGAVVITDGIAYLYHLDATSAAGEASPGIIAPDDNPGDKRWILQDVMCSGINILPTGSVGIRTDSPVAPLDVSQGVGTTLSVGADTDGTTKTNETTKAARLAHPHYLNAEQFVAWAFLISSETNTECRLGGGESAHNAATLVRFYTAADTTTLTGTERMKIASDGGIFMYGLKSGANQAAAGAAANELWHDTDDDTIKLGV